MKKISVLVLVLVLCAAASAYACPLHGGKDKVATTTAAAE